AESVPQPTEHAIKKLVPGATGVVYLARRGEEDASMIPRNLCLAGFFSLVFSACASSKHGCYNPPCGPGVGSGGVQDLSVSVEDQGGVAPPDLAPLVRKFGDPCTDRSQCTTGYCVFAGFGGVCTVECPAIGCPAGYGCYGVLGAG